jgi:transcriptional regulator, padR-like family
MNGRYDFLILHLLSREEMYGFQVIKKVSDRFTDAEFELKTGMLYPLLSALEAKGYLSSRLVPVAGRERKVYKATESGIDYLAHKKEKWYRWEEFANSILEL